MKLNKQFKGFITGIAFTIAFLGMSNSAYAQSAIKTIKVAVGGIQIYVDGELKKPALANGRTVEPLIYEGTTYLPLKPLVGMLTDKEVSWDATTSSIYIGESPASSNVVMIEDIKPLEYYNKTSVNLETNETFKVLEKNIQTYNYLSFNETGSYYITYPLDSNYSSIQGKFKLEQEKIHDKDEQKLKFYSVDSYGNETLLKEYQAKAGDSTIDVSVPLTGVTYLRIRNEMISKDFPRDTVYFYDVTLTPVK